MASEADDIKTAKSFFDMASSRFMEVINKHTDLQQYSLAMGLLNMTKSQNLMLGAIFSRLQRLHQKIDRVEKKLGSA